MVTEDQVLKIPAGLPVDAAATVSVNPCTAFRMLKDFEELEPGNIKIYYVDTSVLLENIPLVKFIKTTSGTRVVYFP